VYCIVGMVESSLFEDEPLVVVDVSVMLQRCVAGAAR